MVDRAEITQLTNERKLTVELITRFIPSVGLTHEIHNPPWGIYTRIYTCRGVNTRRLHLNLKVKDKYPDRRGL
jgi:hypothetical protein